jgi:hypothetical protein
MFYHERNRSVVVIQRLTEGGQDPHGTGFFVSFGERIYLVTCLHVLTLAGGGRSLEGRVKEAGSVSEAVILKLRTKEDYSLSDYRLELSDSSGLRRWRTFLQPENYWDVAVIELERRDMSAYDIRTWKEEEFLSPDTSLDPGTEVLVLTFPRQYDCASTPYDLSSQIDVKENQIFACDKGAVITDPLYPGASGSPLYRAVEITHPNDRIGHETSIQLLGIFTGAFPPEDPKAGHFHYIDTAATIIRAKQDCLDDNGVEFRS